MMTESPWRMATAVLIACALATSALAGEWVVTWQDDFDGPFINTTTWNVANNFTHGDQEWQLYLEDEVYIENSNLVLRTRAREAMYGSKQYNFTSGWVDTKDNWSQQGGRFEVHAKLPNPDASCVWPAHWLLPSPAPLCWPIGGELDIMEMVGSVRNNSITGTYHWGWDCGQDSWDKNFGLYPNTSVPGVMPMNFSAAYHTFGLEWNASAISWYVDNTTYYTRQPPQEATWGESYLPFTPVYFILNTAISFWGCQQPPSPQSWFTVYHYIDWIRALEYVTS
jgi:beta-glucanase (GH16 family)